MVVVALTATVDLSNGSNRFHDKVGVDRVTIVELGYHDMAHGGLPRASRS